MPPGNHECGVAGNDITRGDQPVKSPADLQMPLFQTGEVTSDNASS